METASKLPAEMCRGWQNKPISSSPLGAAAYWRELSGALPFISREILDNDVSYIN